MTYEEVIDNLPISEAMKTSLYEWGVIVGVIIIDMFGETNFVTAFLGCVGIFITAFRAYKIVLDTMKSRAELRKAVFEADQLEKNHEAKMEIIRAEKSKEPKKQFKVL